MKIDGFNIFPNNQLQIIDELNLKEGQKILGKLIRVANDEVLLDIAGRPLSAKVDENTSLTAGTVRMFQVIQNDQGHVVLKVLPNTNSAAELQGAGQNNAPEEAISKSNVNSQIDSQTQKSITAALEQENLPVTAENITKVYKYMQDFQAKYQQTVSPKVFTFLFAQKMPVTPGTILASWVFQDEGVRNQLWNYLRKSLPEKSQLELFSKYVMEPKENTEVIQEKLENILNLKLGAFLEKLISLDSQSTTANKVSENILKNPVSKLQNLINQDLVLDKHDLESLFAKSNIKAQDIASLLSKTNIKVKDLVPLLSKTDIKLEDLESLLQKAGEKIFEGKDHAGDEIKQMPSTRGTGEVNRTERSSPVSPVKVMNANQSPPLVKSQNISGEVDQVNRIQNKPVNGVSGKLGSQEQQKVGSILDNNIELNKALATDKSLTIASCVIPFLIRDSGNQLHECLVKWKKEKSNERGGATEESLQLLIPTENLGEIHLAVRISQSGVRINFRVASEEVRRYLVRHTKDLKAGLSHETAIIAVSLKDNESSGGEASGVDLWM